MFLQYIKQRLWAVIAVLGVATLAVLGAVVLILHRDAATPTATHVTTTTATVTCAATTATQTTTAAQTTAATTTVSTTRPTTTKKTTRRTVAPPPIVVEPENVKDDTADNKKDESIQKPTNTDGVSFAHVRDAFGGKGNYIGIDVSRHNGDIDWKKVKAAGVHFAIIRCGYRGTESGVVYEDAKFKDNIEGALAADIKVGAYFFSAAKTETEALEEAAFVIKVLEPYKDRITWPIAYDFEIFDYDRLTGVDYTTITDNAMAFMDVVAQAGYTPMVYSSRNMFWNQWETARLSPYRVWMAQYVNTLSQKKYDGEHVMWQCASDGRVDGIKGNVDYNIAYVDLGATASPLLPEKAPDSYPVNFKDRSFTLVCEQVKTTSALNGRITPYDKLPNKWATFKKDTVLLRTGIDEKNGWSRIEYNGITLYVSSQYVQFVRTTQTTTTTVTATTVSTTTTTETSQTVTDTTTATDTTQTTA